MQFLERFILIFLCYANIAKGQFYEDRRCICICPSVAAVINNTVVTDRRPYVANVPPNLCNCDGVILQHVGAEIKGHEQEFCPRCDCKYESRNTTIIKFVVILVLWVLALLVIYMVFLLLLDPLIKRKRRYVYTPIHREEVHNLLSSEGFGED